MPPTKYQDLIFYVNSPFIRAVLQPQVRGVRHESQSRRVLPTVHIMSSAEGQQLIIIPERIHDFHLTANTAHESRDYKTIPMLEIPRHSPDQ